MGCSSVLKGSRTAASSTAGYPTLVNNKSAESSLRKPIYPCEEFSFTTKIYRNEL